MLYNNKNLHYRAMCNYVSNGMQVKRTPSSCSSDHQNMSNSSTTIPGQAKNLSDVKNPQFLISFRFTDRRITHLKEIHLFKNLTELDVSGNLL